MDDNKMINSNSNSNSSSSNNNNNSSSSSSSSSIVSNENACSKYEVISIDDKIDNKIDNSNWRKKCTSNHALLRIACFTFGLFVIAEIVGALASGALSLLGDGAAMGVDVITYLANMYAEHIKTHHGFISNRAKWIFRVIIPTFALCSLLSVTAWIASDAIVILYDTSVQSGGDLDISFLWGFSSANMVVDIICNVAFSLRGRTVFYQELEEALFTSEEPHMPTLGCIVIGGIGTDRSHLEGAEADHTHIQPVLDVETNDTNIRTGSVELETMNETNSVDTTVKEVNLNMLSAFTHISADTLRTTTVFIAAAVSTSTGISPDIVDAYAAIVVTGIILCISFPLGHEIYKAIKSIRNETSSSQTSQLIN